ncbi:pectate lyase [Trinickia dinghuensis]|uniref:Pectate lyase n=1 Tax=Trinickia dinghuensis TaxID=2291023 RepID=A0A3D8K6U8_9BURK|nr:pectate lyase [Trinickia dinghuensis]RDV00793.1 pectate lyase [Trinickia dinghuensis]
MSAAALFPVNGAVAAQPDTMLQITFNAPPTLGTTGKISVFNATTNVLVDSIDISGAPTKTTNETYGTGGTGFSETDTEVDALAAGVTTLSGSARNVYYTPVTISGNTATIHLHDGKLSPGTRYYVTVDSTVFSGTQGSFSSFSSATAPAWTFTTGPLPTLTVSNTVPANAPSGTTGSVSVTVDASGNGNFNTVQGALDWLMQNCNTGISGAACTSSSVIKTITVDKGAYNELLFVRNMNNLTITGSTSSAADTTVSANNFESYNPGSGGSNTAAGTSNTTEGAVTRRALGGGRSVFLMEGSDLLTLRNFTLQNSHVKQSSYNNQAETLYFNNTKTNGGRFVASHMQFLSAQDTIQTKGWAYFYDDYIAGDVDFLWGNAYAAMFDHSELHTVYDVTAPTTGGYVIQARAYTGYVNTSTSAFIQTPGFVVSNSTLTADSNVPAGSTFLARAGGAEINCTLPAAASAQGSGCDDVAYVDTQIGAHISAGGWLGAAEGASGTELDVSPSTGQTEMAGWREWGSMNSTGGTLSLSGRDTTVGTDTVALTGGTAALDLTNPSVVFAGWNNGAGWTPTP